MQCNIAELSLEDEKWSYPLSGMVPFDVFAPKIGQREIQVILKII